MLRRLVSQGEEAWVAGLRTKRTMQAAKVRMKPHAKGLVPMAAEKESGGGFAPDLVGEIRWRNILCVGEEASVTSMGREIPRRTKMKLLSLC